MANGNGAIRCGRRRRNCTKCGYKYKKGDRSWECPECGYTRKCQQLVSNPGDACRFHGGASLRGPAHPRWNGGKYAKDLPAALGERFQEAFENPELLTLRHEIALVDARLGQCLSRLSSGGIGEVWVGLRKAWRAFQNAGTQKEVQEAISELSALINQGDADYTAWREIDGLLTQRRKLTESERKARVEAQQIMTMEQAATLMAALTHSVNKRVSDPKERQAIAEDLRDLMNANAVEASYREVTG